MPVTEDAEEALEMIAWPSVSDEPWSGVQQLMTGSDFTARLVYRRV